MNNPMPPARPHVAFEATGGTYIESLNMHVQGYRHIKTGASHFHMDCDFSENVFLVAFRTVPMDSTGVAHILEHTALCGSEHYPVRDPFFMMLRRSLNTFMNAFTSSDWTAYPFASKNRKDFFNLMQVYLDAAFFSRLDRLDFAQEGHRLEFQDPKDPNSPLVFKGVVFNEMKGAMSSPVSTLWQTLTSHLFPTTTYHYNSGGDPEHIPDLTHEDLVAFYRSHYHPTNAVFMTFGNIPAHEHQAFFEEHALSRFDRLEGHSTIAVSDEQRYSEPKRVEETYACDDNEHKEQDKTHIVMGWLLGHNIDLDDLLRCHLLASVLLDNSASPLRYALESSPLGSAPSPLCGLEDSNREMSFVCGLEGSCPEHAEALESLIMDTLESVAQNGVPRDQIEAALHQLELAQREVTGGDYPYGLHLILSAMPAAIHRGDVMAALNLDPALDRLREAASHETFFQDLVRELLLNNAHRVRLTMRPDFSLAQRRDADEKARLERIKQRLSPSELRDIEAQTEALLARQGQEDDPGVLPKVGIEDVPKDLDIAHGETTTLAGRSLHRYAQGTNGLCYQEIVIDLPELDDELLACLPLYTRCLTELGSNGRDYQSTQARQSLVTGGIHAYSNVRAEIHNPQELRGHMILSGKALHRNVSALTELMQETLETTRFDELNHIRELVSQERASREQGVTSQGHSLAMIAASSGFSSAAYLSHELRGLVGIQRLKALDDGLDDSAALEALAGRFSRLHQLIQGCPRQFLLVGEPHHLEAQELALQGAWGECDSTMDSSHRPFSGKEPQGQIAEVWTTSTQVNFCAMVFPTVGSDHEDAPVLDVLGGFLRNGYLHRVIREQGGAYGGGASHDSDNACFRFYSYRDPRLQETLADFERAVEWLLREQHKYRLVEEAILGVIGSMDKPGSPAGEAKRAFHSALYGRDKAFRQSYRQAVLKVRTDDLKRVADRYLRTANASRAIITSSTMADALEGHDYRIIAL